MILHYVVDENDVVEAEALLLHVQEPHAHSTGPHHETNELQEIQSEHQIVRENPSVTYKVDLDEEAPVRETVGACIAGFAQHEICEGVE